MKVPFKQAELQMWIGIKEQIGEWVDLNTSVQLIITKRLERTIAVDITLRHSYLSQ